MNDLYGHHDVWQPVSSSPQSSSFSSISPPSSLTNHSNDYNNITTSSFSHYSPIRNNDVRLVRNFSDTRLDFHRSQPYPTQQHRTIHRTPIRLERRPPFVYRNYTTARRARSPIKKLQPNRLILSGLNNISPKVHQKTPRRTWKRHYKRSESSSSEEVQQIAITIPHSILEQNRCCESRIKSSDEGFFATSDENQAESTDFEDAKTDFMNATDQIYENLRLQQHYPTHPKAPLPSQPPPERDDEPLIYGRLTALLLSNARSNPKTRCKIGQTQSEIKSLLQIQTHVELCVEDEMLFSTNCALFGHQVAAHLRIINQQSPLEFQLQVKKLHKLLYSLKKKNVIFGGFAGFIQKILKAL